MCMQFFKGDDESERALTCCVRLPKKGIFLGKPEPCLWMCRASPFGTEPGDDTTVGPH